MDGLPPTLKVILTVAFAILGVWFGLRILRDLARDLFEPVIRDALRKELTPLIQEIGDELKELKVSIMENGAGHTRDHKTVQLLYDESRKSSVKELAQKLVNLSKSVDVHRPCKAGHSGEMWFSEVEVIIEEFEALNADVYALGAYLPDVIRGPFLTIFFALKLNLLMFSALSRDHSPQEAKRRFAEKWREEDIFEATTDLEERLRGELGILIHVNSFSKV